MAKKFKVRINYKSGRSIVVKTSSLNVKASNGTITSITWNNDTRPRPLTIGLNDIESVWQLNWLGRKKSD